MFEKELEKIIQHTIEGAIDGVYELEDFEYQELKKSAKEQITDLAKKTALECLPEKGSIKDKIVNYSYELRNNPDELYHFVRNQTISQAEQAIKESFK